MNTSEAKKDILLQSRALIALIESAESKRKDRAVALINSHGVYWHGQEGGLIQGGVRASGSGSYLVKIMLRAKQSGIWVLQDTECECFEGKSKACKHVLALAGARLVTLRENWKNLVKADEKGVA